MTNLRLAIVVVAVALVLLSIAPLRRRLPLIRSLPRGFELILWLGFLALCLGAFATVRTIHSTELSLAAAHAGVNIAGQALGSVLGPPAHWVAVHQPGVAIASVMVAGLCWLLIVARTWALVGRAVRPRPHLGGGWVVVERHHHRPGRREPAKPPAIASTTATATTLTTASTTRLATSKATTLATAPGTSLASSLVDAPGAVSHLGSSRPTYRDARAGRRRSRRAGAKSHFVAGDVAALRSQEVPPELNG
jgi:hypothetical protein